MEPGGYSKHPGSNRQSLLFIGVEQPVGAVQRQGKFPAQIVGVLNPGIHTLSTGWRMNVRGIAGQEYPAYAIAIDHPYIGPIKREPSRRIEPQAESAGSLIGDLLEAFE